MLSARWLRIEPSTTPIGRAYEPMAARSWSRQLDPTQRRTHIAGAAQDRLARAERVEGAEGEEPTRAAKVDPARDGRQLGVLRERRRRVARAGQADARPVDGRAEVDDLAGADGVERRELGDEQGGLERDRLQRLAAASISDVRAGQDAQGRRRAELVNDGEDLAGVEERATEPRWMPTMRRLEPDERGFGPIGTVAAIRGLEQREVDKEVHAVTASSALTMGDGRTCAT